MSLTRMTAEENETMLDEVEGGVPLPLSSDTKHHDFQEKHDFKYSADGIPGSTPPEGLTALQPQLSKTQLKKLRKKAEWEAGRQDRRIKRKEKDKARKERKRAALQENEQARAEIDEFGGDDAETGQYPNNKHIEENNYASNYAREPKKPPVFRQLPITIVFDCQFDSLMKEEELISLASQLTRCYSDNRKALYRTHLFVSSFGGRLKDRFEGVLSSHHESWKGVQFLEQDFITAAERAKNWMREAKGGVIAGALQQYSKSSVDGPEEIPATIGEVVYLSSDSPDTLTELRPFSTYIIGGLVDRNRHKGICYQRALERNVRTAKLPIGEFIEMQSRTVLTTNHVNEIILKWLETGDWGEAFFKVIPKRKGGKLKEKNNENEQTLPLAYDMTNEGDNDDEENAAGLWDGNGNHGIGHSDRDSHFGNDADSDVTSVKSKATDTEPSAEDDSTNLKRKVAEALNSHDGVERKRKKDNFAS